MNMVLLLEWWSYSMRFLRGRFPWMLYLEIKRILLVFLSDFYQCIFLNVDLTQNPDHMFNLYMQNDKQNDFCIIIFFNSNRNKVVCIIIFNTLPTWKGVCSQNPGRTVVVELAFTQFSRYHITSIFTNLRCLFFPRQLFVMHKKQYTSTIPETKKAPWMKNSRFTFEIGLSS